jgi:HK97 family phage major capsid protein
VSSRYELILAEVVNEPWAILPEKLQTITELLALRAHGDRLSEDEIRARVGGRESARSPKQSGAVAVIPVYGVINHRMNMMSDISGGTSAEKLTAQFREALNDASISAIVLDVDSPGGGVSGIQELADEIYQARGQKKIVAQVSPLAGSAAYWLASAASEIAIMPSGAAGSIGVYTAHKDLSKALEQNGVKVTLVSAGKFKTEGNEFESLSDDAKAALQKRVDDYYSAFVAGVARGRGVTQANVRSGFGEGRVVSAQDALALGMVDRIATLDQTISSLLGAPASQITARASSEKTATAETQPEVVMSTTAQAGGNAALETMRDAAINAESIRISAIQQLARHCGMTDKAAAWIRESKSVDAVSAEINDILAKRAKPVATGPEPGAQVELSDREQRQYSMMRAIRGLMARAGKGLGKDEEAGLEFEISDSIAKKLGRDTGGLYVPTNIKSVLGSRALTSERARQQFEAVLQGTSGQQPGTNLVQTTILPSEFIELLRNLQVVMKAGARKLGDLQGNVQFPKQTAAATMSWTGENPGAAVTATDQTFGNSTMSPKTAMAQTLYSRQFLIQSSLDAEQLIREDLAAIFALGLDLAAMEGTGASNQPTGVVNTAGVTVVPIGVNGGAITYNLLIDCQTALENNNVPIISPATITTPGVKGKLRKTAKLANTIADAIWGDDNSVAGYPGLSTNQLPQNLTKGTGTNLHRLITGSWNNVVIGEWGALELIVDPYTQAGKNNVVITGNMLVDILIRYAKAFAVMSDIDPTQ